MTDFPPIMLFFARHCNGFCIRTFESNVQLFLFLVLTLVQGGGQSFFVLAKGELSKYWCQLDDLFVVSYLSYFFFQFCTFFIIFSTFFCRLGFLCFCLRIILYYIDTV